ncbi:MAG: menaquinone biosynthesis decarboxylase [Armatimonadetes bacterium]|nr:menaquinone biosynthesis decarboxylase [Armatimonadota bacterium]
MPYQDLRDYLKILEKKNQLHRISTEVDPVLEMTEIADRLVKTGGPVVFFEKAAGSSLPVVMGLFGTEERMELALETRPDELAGRIRDLLTPSVPDSLWGKLSAMPKLMDLARIPPKKIKDGPCQDIVDRTPRISELPVLRCWPEDGGRYITLPMVITADPETGQRNVGMYRLQVYDDTTMGMHWHIHKHGTEHYRKYRDRMPVAVAIGGDPATIFASIAPLPQGLDEFFFSGFIRRAPVEVVKGVTVDLEVPAHAEIILEGYVDPEELRMEGPFGDHTGYYSMEDLYPVFHLTCMTRRKDALYPATVVGRPPMEDFFMGKGIERIFLPLIQLFLPEISDMNFPMEGVFHHCLVVSIRKRFPGQARKVMYGIWGLGQLMFTKVVVVVEDHINVQNLSEVALEVFNHTDPQRDVVVVSGPADTLDHSPNLPDFGSKMGIDGTRKGAGEGYMRQWPRDIRMSQEIKDRVDRRWEEYGFRKT